VSIGRAAAVSKESPARNIRMASRKAEVSEKGLGRTRTDEDKDMTRRGRGQGRGRGT